jgi:succinate dehydrogenase / fumarate reductase membrane anchor subunit
MMRTPLGRVRGLGSARSGTDHFWRQRLTGLALVPLAVFFVFTVIALQGEGHATVVATLANPIVGILTLLFVIAGVWHMKIGMQVVIEDYVHAEGLKVLALAGNVFFAAAVGVACAWAVIKIGFGG